MKKIYITILVALLFLINFPINVVAAPVELNYSMIFSEDNRIEVDYGIYGIYRPASGRNHLGIDIDTEGEPTIHATIGGTVRTATEYPYHDWTNTWQCGWYIWIDGDDGYSHLYAHCKEDSFLVKPGDRVESGEAIAIMGQTGNAQYDEQGDHVHYQVQDSYGNIVDPTFACGIKNEVGSTLNPNNIQEEGQEKS